MSETSPRKKRKLIAFVDGFNLYYGLLKENPGLRWMNVKKVIQAKFPDDEIVSVKYFTARVDDDGRQRPSDKRVRQDTYCKALEAQGVVVVDGKLEYREKACFAPHCALPHPRFFRAPVEKMTDVNIALQLVADTAKYAPDVVVVVSGDTDLLPALIQVRSMMRGLKQVLIPCSEQAMKFRRVDQFGQHNWVARRLTEADVKVGVMGPEVLATTGEVLRCPLSWN